MKIHYISCHAVLEYDEVKLLTELGHEVYSNGAYRDPKGAYTLPRPGIEGAPFDEKFFQLTAEHPKTALPPELIDPYDVIIIMHSPEVLFANWERIKHKRVIWRTIGQSLPHIEAKTRPLKNEGLKIVRYSLMERNLDQYAGEDAVIYFYKDPDEFKDWNGDAVEVVNFSQALLGRRYFCHYDEVTEIMKGYPGKVYGSGNDDLGSMNGGDIPYELLKGKLRDARAYVYGGTWPASYTLSFIEAMMTGIPIIALGRGLAQSDRFEKVNFYEVPDFIQHRENGFCSDDIIDLRECVNMLLKDHAYAKIIGAEGRKRAIAVFGKERIGKQWQDFLQV